MRQLRFMIYAHISTHRGFYFLAFSAGLVGLCCGWSVASGMSGGCLETLSYMVGKNRDRNQAAEILDIFLSAQGRWALLLGWMMLSAMSRFTIPVPLAVLFIQCFSYGLTLHALMLVEIGLIYAIVLLTTYGIIILLTIPLLSAGAVLSMGHAAGISVRTRRWSARFDREKLFVFIRNMIFLFICGVPVSCARCLLGLILQ